MSSSVPLARRSPLRDALLWATSRDPYAWAFLLILATITVDAAFGDTTVGRLASLALSGGTLLLILWTSRSSRRTWRLAGIAVLSGVLVGSVSAILGTQAGYGTAVAVGLGLALVAQIAILRHITSATSVTVHLILGALCVYLLIGVAYASLFPLVGILEGTPFFVQAQAPVRADYVYFSFVTLTTVGYGDLTAATHLGRIAAISEALLGQLYLVSAVALLVGNIGRARRPIGDRE